MKVDNKVLVGGFDDSFFNKNVVVKTIASSTSFTVNAGVSTIAHGTAGNGFVYPTAYTSAGGAVVPATESASGRVVSTYAGITTTISSGVTATAGTITIANATNFDLNIGDYLLVDSEIVRVKTTVTSNSVSVFRGLLGTEQTAHDSGAVIRRIKPNPIELRRNSLFVLLLIPLSILDMVLVTTPLLSQKGRIETSVHKKKFLHSLQRATVVLQSSLQ